MALEKLPVGKAVRRADNRARPSLDMVHHPGADRFVIAGEICLRHRLAVAGVRPERLVGVRDQNADDIFLATFAEGLGLSFWSGKCPRPVDLTSRRTLLSRVGDAMSGVLGSVHGVGCVLAHPANGVAAG